MKNASLLWVAVGVLALVIGGCPTTPQELTNADLAAPSMDTATPAVTADTTPSTTTPDSADSGTAPADGGSANRPVVTALEPPAQDSADAGDTNESSTSSDPSSTATPPTSQESQAGEPDPNEVAAAVDFVARQFVAVGALFSAFGELGDPRLSVEPYTTVNWGTCPNVAIASSDLYSLIGLDFGAGCAAACAGGNRVIGANGEIYWRQGAPSEVYVARGFVVDGHAITPLEHHPEFTDPNTNGIMNADMLLHSAGVTLTGDCDFATQGVGRASGTLTLDIGRQYVLTFSTADFTFDDGAQQQQPASFTAAIVRPPVYGNFVPDAGAATFTAALSDGAHDIKMEFTAQSPVDGTVNVTIDGNNPFSYTLPLDVL